MARTAVVAGTATAVSNRVSRRQGERWQTQADAEAYQQQQAYGAPPPPQQYQQAPPQYQEPPPQYAAPPPPPPAPAPVVVVQEAAPDTSSKLAQLQQLGDLKAQGILTEAEFEAQKAKILAG
jgi:hypothetical protein